MRTSQTLRKAAPDIMKQIKFKAPTHLHGQFTTPRLGKGWTMKVEKDEEVEMVDEQGNSYGVAKITGHWNGPLDLVPGSLLELMHDPLGRTFSGLIWIMRIVYPGEPILPTSNVTVLVLEKIRDRVVVVPKKGGLIL